PAPAKRKRKGLRLIILAALLGAGWFFGEPWLLARWSHVNISDARIAASLVTVSSEVRGRVIAIPVIGGDNVARDEPLVLIDPEQAQLSVTGAKARLDGIEAKRHQLSTQQDMIRLQITSRRAAAEARITTAEANHDGSIAALRSVQSQFNRISELVDRNISSAQAHETALAELDTARQRELASKAAILTAQANLAVIEADAVQIEVIDTQIAALLSEQVGLEASHEQTLLDVERREISAAFDGVVDATFVDVGEYVTPGTRLLIYHQPDKIWVNANVKETNFRKITLGAPATIKVDAYPDREFHGAVERLGGAATSQFALLPSPNPSGNFTKVTQRLPIRVSIDTGGAILSPGMMVELSIDVTD
ncbi:MAG: HlyD family secretion protein, partial [Rhodobacteraceae bacterium]|nr:HlyD family secretion protein [Paracoccaceae bacterium]